MLVLVLVLALAVAGCGADGAATSSGATVTTSPGPATSSSGLSAAPATTTARGLADQYGVRYCEVLTVTVADSGTTAEVWGTQGLNDCPQALFETIDPAVVRAEIGATAALRNGPRYWVLDDIVANQLAGSGEIRSFGGIEMRSIATVDLGRGLPDRRPYTPISVERDTEFRFDAGRRVHELTAPDGAVYVMQSYSTEIDPALTAEALAELGRRLQLPPGWSFTSRVLDESLVVEDIDGIATVVQDELANSYQLRSRG